MDESSRQEATLGGGCFWCLEAVFQQVPGVEAVISGYAGGHVPEPTYRQVCAGETGHAEVVRVVFDPEEVSYRHLLQVFFAVHDPTTPERQGADVGPQYRSIILYHSAEQRDTARAVVRELEAAGTWRDPVVTEMIPCEAFYPAESEHQDFFRRRRAEPYCRLVIEPKMAKYRQTFGS